jgi:predicted nucleotidyltransferase
MTHLDKEAIKKDVVRCLAGAEEIKRIVVFGSFLTSDDPNDIDVAIFQGSKTRYLDLAMKYRKMLHPVLRKIAVDVIPIRPEPNPSFFLGEIEAGEVIYER